MHYPHLRALARPAAHNWPRALASGLALVIAVAVAGCGTNPAASHASGQNSSQTPAAPSWTGSAADLLTKYEALPTFEQPAESFNARAAMKDKAILAIPVTSANPFTSAYLGAIEKMSHEIGFKFQKWDNQGSLAEWKSGIEFGISQKVSLIDLAGGVQPNLLGPEIKRARDAGIIVVDSHQTDVSQGTSPHVDFTIPAPYGLAGQLMAAWTAKATNMKADALIITSSDVRGSPAFVSSIEDSFKQFCDSCKFKVVDVPVAKWASDIGPAIVGAVQSDPNLNYILPIYDPESQFVVSTLKQLNKVGKIGIATYAGTPFVLDYIKQGSVQMVVGENLEWVGYAMLDAEMRLIAGQKAPFPEFLATRVFNSDNIGDPTNMSASYGTAVGAGWSKLWQLTSN